jgi:UDP-N-acetyl-D-mannosaminuronic acid transferase (WecB/TagA/CpsF family)
MSHIGQKDTSIMRIINKDECKLTTGGSFTIYSRVWIAQPQPICSAIFDLVKDTGIYFAKPVPVTPILK